MNVTNREARQWDKVHHQAAMRQIAKQRQEAVKPILEAREQLSAVDTFLRGQEVHAPSSRKAEQRAADGAGLGYAQARQLGRTA